MRWRDVLPGRGGPTDAYLSLGSNVGDRDEHLLRAIGALRHNADVRVTAVSGVYETEPVGGVEQDPYLNAVVAVTTSLGPRDLLLRAQAIEAAHGRDRSREERWGPRPLDIDILLFGDRVMADRDLTIPHPRMHERAFVLIPLLEIAPGAAMPDGTRLSALVNALAPIEGVDLAYRYRDMPGAGPGRPAGPNSPSPVLSEHWTPPRGAPTDITDLPAGDAES